MDVGHKYEVVDAVYSGSREWEMDDRKGVTHYFDILGGTLKVSASRLSIPDMESGQPVALLGFLRPQRLSVQRYGQLRDETYLVFEVMDIKQEQKLKAVNDN